MAPAGLRTGRACRGHRQGCRTVSLQQQARVRDQVRRLQLGLPHDRTLLGCAVLLAHASALIRQRRIAHYSHACAGFLPAAYTRGRAMAYTVRSRPPTDEEEDQWALSR